MITWIMFDCYNIAIIRQRVSKLIQSEQCRRSGKLRRCHSEDLSLRLNLLSFHSPKSS
ncbi:unnamed protein product [Tenebrio molitor]|nr:unnamed protein product [Tenebrio molitor]